MQLSSWYLEIHARETQRCAMREAELARQVDAAARHGAQSDGKERLTRPWRAVSALLAWLAPRGSRRELAEAAPVGAACQPARPRASAGQPQLRRPARAAEPYAGMVVIACGQPAPPRERPRPVRTC